MSTASLTAPGAEALERQLTARLCPLGTDKAPEPVMGSDSRRGKEAPGPASQEWRGQRSRLLHSGVGATPHLQEGGVALLGNQPPAHPYGSPASCATLFSPNPAATPSNWAHQMSQPLGRALAFLTKKWGRPPPRQGNGRMTNTSV